MAWMRMMGAESVAYHRETVMGRADDHPGLAASYYASHGETPLGWGGSGAQAFGLDGAVTDDQYDAVFGPGGFRDPTTGTRLVTTTRPGIELVVSAHKSVALLGLMGWADHMHAILDAETGATLGFLDDWVRGVGGRRGRAQQRTPTEGLVYARTRHATSRAGDPEPHDHVLIANLVEMLDERGGYKALDTALVRDVVHAATMVGRLAAAHRAVELGVAIAPDPGPSGKLGHWRIAGIPLMACDVFSKRSAEIDAAVAKAGHGTYQARQLAARATRRAKRHTAEAELMPVWRRELEAVGLGVDRLRAMVMEDARELGRPERTSTRRIQQLAADALAPNGALAERKVFTRADVIVAVTPALYGQDPALLGSLISHVLRHPEAIPLVGVTAARDQAYAPACVVAVEAAVVRTMEEGAGRVNAPKVTGGAVERAIRAKETLLRRPLTAGQADAVIGLCTSGRSVEVVLGVAGAGKTTMLDVVRAAFEASDYQVMGTATSGQAARTLGREAHLDQSRTVASLLWRLDHGRLEVGDRTVLVIDEAAMTDDKAVLRLLTLAETAGAKSILVGDHRQLGAIGPSGALEGLVQRFPDAVHVMRENVRQADPEERTVLAHLRAGDVGRAVDWYVRNDRVRTVHRRSDALSQVVDGWYDDVRAGVDCAMFAWRRANVAELNHLARDRWLADGRLSGPELVAPGGHRYAAGDRVVTLAPGPEGMLVTSEHGVVEAVHPTGSRLSLRMADDRLVGLDAVDAGADKLDYGYATTVHRSQGETTSSAHRFADGGGRELGYVSMSRATGRSTVYVVADDVAQARADLIQDWSSERRQRWAIDTGTPTSQAAEIEDAPNVERGLRDIIREARLRAEYDAVAGSVPPDVSRHLRNAQDRLAWLHDERDRLERGSGGHLYTPEGRAGFALRTVETQLEDARHRAADRYLHRSERRAARHQIEDLTPRLAAARSSWDQIAGPRHAAMSLEIEHLTERAVELREQVDVHRAWIMRHPEAIPRLERLNRELEALRSPAVSPSPVSVSIEPPSPALGFDVGPELAL